MIVSIMDYSAMGWCLVAIAFTLIHYAYTQRLCGPGNGCWGRRRSIIKERLRSMPYQKDDRM